MLRTKVFPAVDFLYAFLQTRGFLLVDNKPNILHYTGDNRKELLNLIKEDKPDLLILHSKDLPGELPLGVFWVYHPVKVEKDLYAGRKLLTNSYRLCQHYYQKLGLQAEIIVLPKDKKKKDEVNFASQNNRLLQFWIKIKQIMFWE